MGLVDKAKNKAEQVKGQAKEQTGKATDNEDLEAEGHADQTKGNVKDAGEKVKDAFKSDQAQHTEHPTGQRQAARMPRTTRSVKHVITPQRTAPAPAL